MLNAIWFFVLIAVIGLGVWAPSRYVLAPMRRPKLTRRDRFQVQMIDFLSLVAVIQYAMAAVAAAWRIEATLGVITAIYSLPMMIGLWFVGVRTLTDARVEDSRRRLAFLSVVLPAVAATSLAFVPIALFVIAQIVDGRRDSSWPLVGLILVPLAMLGCRKLVDWIAEGRIPSPPRSAESEPNFVEGTHPFA
jgi:hypothetical protein